MGLALDLWNQAEFSLDGEEVTVEVRGEGLGHLATDSRNLVARSALRLYQAAGLPEPAGLHIACENAVPMGSGLGSSSAAVVAGLLGANALLGQLFSREEILLLATELEGHPDNVAPALLGGLVVAAVTGGTAEPLEGRERPKARPLSSRRIELPPLKAAVAVPEFDLPTRTARAALPRQIPLADAVFNIGHAVLVLEALRTGDLELLSHAMDDRLHQPYRLKLIPGAVEVLQAARQAGAAAAAISGAGPGIIAFTRQDPEAVAEAMIAAFSQAGLTARGWALSVSNTGAQVECG
jgi:homoserine kinase